MQEQSGKLTEKDSNDHSNICHGNNLSLLEKLAVESNAVRENYSHDEVKETKDEYVTFTATDTKKPQTPNKNIMFLENIQEALDEEKVDNFHASLLEKMLLNYKSEEIIKQPLKDKNEITSVAKLSKKNSLDKENMLTDSAEPRLLVEKRTPDGKVQMVAHDITNEPNHDYPFQTSPDKVSETQTTNKTPTKFDVAESIVDVAPKTTVKSSRYVLIRTIGRGNFAKVKLARHLATKKLVAIKIIDKSKLTKKILNKITREVSLMKELSHPNIVKLLEVMENETTLYLVMEYASGGELFDYLVANGCMKEKDARVKFREMVSAVQYCHSKMTVHRDLKAENMLLNSKMEIKIADFGFANKFDLNTTLGTFCGSPPYAAPEIFLGKQYVGPEVDIWALGVMLFTLVSGRLPFDGVNFADLRNKVINLRYELPYFISFECENLLKKMLVVNVNDRATMEIIMNDAWVNGAGLPKMKCYKEKTFVMCPRRLELLKEMGYKETDINETFREKKFNIIHATYILLSQPKYEDTSQHQNSSRLSQQNHDTITKTSPRPIPSEFPGLPEQYSEKQNSRSLSGPPALSLAQYIKSWFFKKPDTVEHPKERLSTQADTLTVTSSKELFHEYQKAMSNFTNDLISDPNSSVPRGANQQAILATINQMSITKHQRAGMFVSYPIGTPTQKQIMEANQLSAPPVFMKTARRSVKTSTETVHTGKFTVQEVKNTPFHNVNPPKKTNFSSKLEDDSVKSLPKRNSKVSKAKKSDDPTSLRESKKKIRASLTPEAMSAITAKMSATGWNEFDAKIKPSVANFVFSMNTVSSLHADLIIVEVVRVLEANKFIYEFLEKYLLLCHLGNKQVEEYGDSVQWEVEVCRIPALFMNGVRMKRIFGSTFVYKRIGSIITKSLKL